jgi:hypothetical protein
MMFLKAFFSRSLLSNSFFGYSSGPQLKSHSKHFKVRIGLDY